MYMQEQVFFLLMNMKQRFYGATGKLTVNLKLLKKETFWCPIDIVGRGIIYLFSYENNSDDNLE